jgi:UDP-glucose 4-epimerase
MPMKILITGAVGKLGRAIADHLHEVGYEVVGADQTFTKDVKWKLIVANVLQREAIYGLLEGVDAVVHLANYPNANYGSPQQVYADNVAMDMNVFQAALEFGVKRIIFSSSIQVTSSSWPVAPGFRLDPPPFLPVDHTLPCRPANPYALSKQAGEDMLRYFVGLGLRSGIALRFPFVHSHHHLRIGGYLKRIWTDNRNEFHAFLDIRDTGPLIESLLSAELPGYHVFFPTASVPGRGADAEEVRQEFFPDVPLRGVTPPLTHLVDCSELERLTGWKPQYGWEDFGT